MKKKKPNAKKKQQPKPPPIKKKPPSMNTKQYLAALDNLGLTVSGKATTKALGLSMRQIQRMAAGDVTVPRPVERLIDMYLKHGLDDE